MQTCSYLRSATLWLVLITAPSQALAQDIDCTCRYKGQDIAEGGVICAELPSGNVLMQCGKVLNNTAWKTLQKECPSAKLTSQKTQSTI